MSRIVGVYVALPPYRYSQREITEAFAEVCLGPEGRHQLLRRLHTNARVETRYLALPLERYRDIDGFTAANDAYLAAAIDLGVEAVAGALAQAGLRAADVDVIVSTTTTGVAVPSLDARIAAKLGFRPDIKRMPLFGLGCLGGAAGIARMHDYLLAWPGQVAVLLAVELCSLTVQQADPSTANMVAAGLFGDGAAAVVAVGSERSAAAVPAVAEDAGTAPATSSEQSAGAPSPQHGPTVVATRSHLYPDTERAMGFDVGSFGLRIVLGVEVPELAERNLSADVGGLLADHDLTLADVATWVCHPGGPRVLEAVQSTLDLPAGALDLTWRSLATIGNISSASVLHVLRDTLQTRPPAPGSVGVMLALGPGFAAEVVLLRW